MKTLLTITILALVLSLLSLGAISSPISKEERICQSIGYISYSIMMDVQGGEAKADMIESFTRLNRLEKAKELLNVDLLDVIEKAYTVDRVVGYSEQKQEAFKFSHEREFACLLEL